MIKIGIISDTHKKIGRAHKIIDLFVEQQCQYIIHAGDIVKEEILHVIENSNIDYVAVLGNNDYHLTDQKDQFNLYEEPHYFVIQDYKIKLMHHPFYLSIESCDIIIFGHTHDYHCTYKNGVLFLNPGEAGARDSGISNAIVLEIHKNHYIVDHWQRKIGYKKWQKYTNKVACLL